MVRFSRSCLLAGAAIGVIAIAGCGTSTPSVEVSSNPSSPESSPAATASPETTQSPETSQGFDGLSAVVTNTKSAVESDDFSKAQAEFSQFETYWSQVEDGVKAKSSDTYDAIEESMDQISSGLRASQPKKDELLTQLTALEEQINAAKP